jgi:hypothetical protein
MNHAMKSPLSPEKIGGPLDLESCGAEGGIASTPVNGPSAMKHAKANWDADMLLTNIVVVGRATRISMRTMKQSI